MPAAKPPSTLPRSATAATSSSVRSRRFGECISRPFAQRPVRPSLWATRANAIGFIGPVIL